MLKASRSALTNPRCIGLLAPIARRPSKDGPIRIPATRYAVTAGNFITFARRESKSPARRAIDKLSKICCIKISNVNINLNP